MGDEKRTFKKPTDIVNKGIKTIMIIVLVSIILPLFLDKFVFGNNIISNITNGEWASFLGSLFGGVIGGIGTLVAVLISIQEGRNVQYKSARPILILEEDDSKSGIMGYGEKTKLYNIDIKNIGIGIASNIEVFMKLKEGGEAKKTFKNPIPSDGSLKDFMIKDTRSNYVFDSEIDYKEPLEIRYEDLLGHKFITKYKLSISTGDIISGCLVGIEEVIEVGKEIL